MEELEDNTIQLIITSPPYGKIKNYGLEDQIGFFDSFEDYFRRLKSVWIECYRVLEPQCRMVINIGDQYLRTAQYGRYRILPIATKIINDCIELGFDFLGDIIWQKISTTNTTGGCTFMGSIYYPRNGLLTYDYEHILIFKKHEGKKKKVDIKTKELSKISLSEWKKWYVGHWRFPGIIQKEHIAMFPEELPYRIIRMFSFIDDTILDPFVGSGTTLKVAKSLYRKSIGYEINENFKNTINDKIKAGTEDLFKDYQYVLQKLYQKCLNEKINILYEKQKKKGILNLRNDQNQEIIIDYLLLDDVIIDKDSVIKEFKTKLEENTVKNYVEESGEWRLYINYIIIINSLLQNSADIIKIGQEYITSCNFPKPIQIFSIEDVILDNFRLSEFF